MLRIIRVYDTTRNELLASPSYEDVVQLHRLSGTMFERLDPVDYTVSNAKNCGSMIGRRIASGANDPVAPE